MRVVIDYRLLLGITVADDDRTLSKVTNKGYWTRDSRMIFFPLTYKYDIQLNNLDSFQHLQRIRLLYPMLSQLN